MLILLRHGESAWNASDRFAGWADVDLTERGSDEARAAGRSLTGQGIRPTLAHTSLLRRARRSAALVLAASGTPNVPLRATARLNERHYGALQGVRRADAVEQYGVAAVARWRRGIDYRPPVDVEGRAESLVDVRRRLVPYVETGLFPALDRGHTLLVVSHGNTLRMLRQLLEGLSDDEAAALEPATGEWRVYPSVSDLLRAG